MIAYDILNSSTSFDSEYSLMDRLNFEKYIIKQINKIDIEDRDDDFLKLKILEMYANPLRNAMLHRESFEEVSQS